MLLANVLYFKATWLDAFNADLTKKGPFNLLSGQTTEVEYMRFSEDLFFAEDSYFLKCKVIAKPYRTAKDFNIASRINMYIILPDEGNNIDNVINSISDLNFNQMLQNGREHKVTYSMPKVNLKSKHKFMPFLNTYFDGGVDYTVERLTLSSDIKTPFQTVPLTISDISQETVLIVDEKGTLAASVSSSSIDYSAPDKSFIVDRPFIMLIREEDTKFVLFWATVRNPIDE